MATIIVLFFPMRAWVMGVAWAGISTYFLITEMFLGSTGTTAHSAHLGGIVAGFVFWRYAGVISDFRMKLERAKEEKRLAKRRQDREYMDKLLEKVGKEGLHSLSDKERTFLKEMSRKMR